MGCLHCGLDVDRQEPMVTRSQLNRIVELNRCNTYPFGQERKDLECVVRGGNEHSAHLRDRRDLLKEMLQRVEGELTASDAVVASASCALHPARGLPREILSDIFIALANATPSPTFDELCHGTFQDSLAMENPHWVVSQVSSGWRSTALTTPQLWTTLSLNLAEYGSTRSMLYLLDVYLSRSAGRDLFVHLFNSNDSLGSHCASIVLLLSCARWKSASLALPYEMYREFEDLPHPFRKLESLTIHCPDVEDAIGSLESTVFRIDMVPALRSLHFSDTLALGRFSLSFHALQHYHYIAGRPAGSFSRVHLTVLAHANSLQSAAITLHEQEDPTGSGIPALQADKLRSLTIRGPGVAIGDFCEKLTLPSLEHLQYHSKDPLNLVFSDNRGSSLIAAHGQALSSVSFTIIDPLDMEELSALTRMLDETKTIRRLELVFDSDFSLDALCFALVATKEKPIAPELETLVLKAGYGCYLSRSFISMIVSRRTGVEGVGMLKRVEVDFAEYDDDRDDLDVAFSSFRAEGLEGFILKEASDELKEATALGFDRIL